MPKSARRACTQSGCPAFSCDQDGCIKRKQGFHKPKTIDTSGRGSLSRDKAYNTARWAKVRHNQMTKSPLCQRCLSFGLTTLATDSDHVLPHRGDPKLMWDANNLQSLCRSCHSVKTREELKGVYNDYRNYVA